MKTLFKTPPFLDGTTRRLPLKEKSLAVDLGSIAFLIISASLDTWSFSLVFGISSSV